MTGALVLSAALMGLAGMPHCAAMCAAPCAAAARACGGPGGQRDAQWALLAGRLVGYSAAGAVAATVAGSLRWLAEGTAWLHPFWSMLQMAVLALGLWLLVRARLPAWMDAAAARVGRWPRTTAPRLAGIPVLTRTAALGTAWVLLPCGFLHAALLLAALTSSPLEGAGAMAAFALTSSAGLVVAPRLLWRLAPGGEGGASGSGVLEAGLALRLAGASLVAASAWALLHQYWAPFLAWCQA